MYIVCLKQVLKHRLKKVGSLEQVKERSHMLDHHHHLIFICLPQYARHSIHNSNGSYVKQPVLKVFFP